jgi:aerobic carbon-monoxide dehydrogenase large subunit
MSKYVGQAMKRVEDPRLITGSAKYLEDIQLPGMTYAAVLRSPHAHAKIKSINTDKAKALAGVVGVYTGKDFAHLNPLPIAWQAGGVKNNANSPKILETDKVTHLGAGVAVVVAENRYIAEDALELIQVDYDILPAVTNAKKATEAGAPQLHENAPNNINMEWECGDAAATDKALSSAEVVVNAHIVNQRLIPTPMETRGAVGQYNPGTGEYTVWLTSQAPHVMRLLMTAFVFGIPETKMRCISPQVGGGFGAKIFLYHEYPMVAEISKMLNGRPVKWMESRSENYVATTHGRDHITDLEVAAKKDGTITGLKVTTYANLGGVLSTIAPGIPTTLYGRMLSGAYKIPAIYCKVYGVYTNTAMVDAYRGAGRPEASFVVERAVDLVADKLGLDPAEVRRKNFIQPQDFPYKPASNILNGLEYDSGEYEKAMDKTLEIIDYKAFRKEQAEARKHGKYLGIGLASYIEICGVAPSKWIGLGGEGWGAGLWESANVRVHLTGKVVATTGSQSHGQGHETTFAQIVADELGMPVEDVMIQHSDTLGTPFGYGTYGSRSTPVGAIALHTSLQRIKEKARKLGAHLLEASVDDVIYEDGKVFVKGVPANAKTIQEIAGAAALAYNLPPGMEPFLDDTAYYDPPNCTYPFGTHAAIVEVDATTGHVEVKRYVAVDDCGPMINPMIAEGQVHGGITQGLAQALYEGAEYDDNGQLLTASLMDYALPKAFQVPHYEIDHTVTPSPVNAMGVKGIGEAGTISSASAVVNAVVDALKPFGINNIQMPLRPRAIVEAIAAASPAQAAD